MYLGFFRRKLPCKQLEALSYKIALSGTKEYLKGQKDEADQDPTRKERPDLQAVLALADTTLRCTSAKTERVNDSERMVMLRFNDNIDCSLKWVVDFSSGKPFLRLEVFWLKIPFRYGADGMAQASVKFHCDRFDDKLREQAMLQLSEAGRSAQI